MPGMPKNVEKRGDRRQEGTIIILGKREFMVK